MLRSSHMDGFDVVVKLLIKIIGIWLIFRKKVEMDSVGRTPLIYAVWNGHMVVVKRLLRAGARIDLADDIGGTAPSYAQDKTRKALLLAAAEKK
jgi:ankyrin repeat protein